MKNKEVDPLDRLAVLEDSAGKMQAQISDLLVGIADRDATIEGLTKAVGAYKGLIEGQKVAATQAFVDSIAVTAVKANSPIDQETLEQIRVLHAGDEKSAGILADALLEVSKLKGVATSDDEGTELVSLGTGSEQAQKDHLANWEAAQSFQGSN